MEERLKSYRGPSYRYKIRKLNPGNKTGESFGINIPRTVASMFDGVEFNIFVAGSSIVLASGCKIERGKNENTASQ